MKSTTIVIPTYWAPGKKQPDYEEKTVFDHPTPLDEAGTLPRLLDSLKVLGSADFQIVIVTVGDTEDITKDVIAKMENLVKPYRQQYDIALLDNENLHYLRNTFIRKGISKFSSKLLNLKDYASVRNMCALAGILNNSEITIFIDDDEVFTDPHFLNKAYEFIGIEYEGQKIKAVAGYYLQPNNNYKFDTSQIPAWRRPYWNNAASMNEAFDLIIGKPPRLKPTPFVFGGNMVIHRDVLMKVPFDSYITRGEDIDYLINLRINGITFYLDRELSIKHLPPKTFQQHWKRVREDSKRFLYERKKVLDHQNLSGVNPQALMPYPGIFLGPDLDERIIKTNELLKKEYEKQGEKQAIVECEVNVQLVKNNQFNNIDTCRWLKELTKNWQELTTVAKGEGIPE